MRAPDDRGLRVLSFVQNKRRELRDASNEAGLTCVAFSR